MQSNINLDLNNSIILQETNDKYAYANVTMYNIENSSITNGIIIGDKNEHIYNQDNGISHEGGYGISVIACNNINISNLEIYDMTGDGINLYGINKGEQYSKNVTIENCNIYNCRRQGITIGCGETIYIKNNEIHDINGTAPQAAIDLEGNYQSEKIDKIYIEQNKFYNLGNVNALLLVGFIENVEIIGNEIEQNILVYDAKDTIKVENNIIKNGNVNFSNDYTNMSAGHNINNVIFMNNTMENSSLRLSKVTNGNIISNQIINGNIEFVSSNGKITENKLENHESVIETAIDLSNISGHTEKYNVTLYDNQIQGLYKNKIIIDNEYYTVINE